MSMTLVDHVLNSLNVMKMLCWKWWGGILQRTFQKHGTWEPAQPPGLQSTWWNQQMILWPKKFIFFGKKTHFFWQKGVPIYFGFDFWGWLWRRRKFSLWLGKNKTCKTIRKFCSRFANICCPFNSKAVRQFEMCKKIISPAVFILLFVFDILQKNNCLLVFEFSCVKHNKKCNGCTWQKKYRCCQIPMESLFGSLIAQVHGRWEGGNETNMNVDWTRNKHFSFQEDLGNGLITSVNKGEEVGNTPKTTYLPN